MFCNGVFFHVPTKDCLNNCHSESLTTSLMFIAETTACVGFIPTFYHQISFLANKFAGVTDPTIYEERELVPV